MLNWTQDVVLEKGMITAQKREQASQGAQVSMGAFIDTQLRDAGSTHIEWLDFHVPDLQINRCSTEKSAFAAATSAKLRLTLTACICRVKKASCST